MFTADLLPGETSLSRAVLVRRAIFLYPWKGDDYAHLTRSATEGLEAG
jgi:hypothetical protein